MARTAADCFSGSGSCSSTRTRRRWPSATRVARRRCRSSAASVPTASRLLVEGEVFAQPVGQRPVARLVEIGLAGLLQGVPQTLRDRVPRGVSVRHLRRPGESARHGLYVSALALTRASQVGFTVGTGPGTGHLAGSAVAVVTTRTWPTRTHRSGRGPQGVCSASTPGSSTASRSMPTASSNSR